ncbi:hypothetical protein GCM10022294_16170 [Dietzia aurantiaca]
MAGAGAGDDGRGDGVDDDNAVGPVGGDPVDGEGEEFEVAGVSDPAAISSSPDAPVEHPAVVRVTNTNAAARDRRAWWWGIGAVCHGAGVANGYACLDPVTIGMRCLRNSRAPSSN